MPVAHELAAWVQNAISTSLDTEPRETARQTKVRVRTPEPQVTEQEEKELAEHSYVTQARTAGHGVCELVHPAHSAIPSGFATGVPPLP
jgi:hypothetical protein